MTTNRATKRAVRDRMEVTGEPYTLALSRYLANEPALPIEHVEDDVTATQFDTTERKD